MLTPIGPEDPPTPTAYPVPWRVRRADREHPVIANLGAEPADFVRVFVEDDSPDERTELWGQVAPGEGVELCLCTVNLDEAVITIAWFRPSDGVEYLWRLVV